MADEAKVAEPKVEEKLLTQAQVDAIVQDRLSREKAKFADYEDLRKFKTEHERELEAATQKELEAKKEYDKLKEGLTKKEQEYLGLIEKKDSELKDMRIGSALMGEIVKQNAYAEETMALIKQQAVFDKENNIRIKGRDANGLEVLNSVEEGVRQFLTQRPHLVKVVRKDGGGTGQGNANPGTALGGDDLTSLSNELIAAQSRGDVKRTNELKTKIRAVIGSQRTKL